MQKRHWRHRSFVRSLNVTAEYEYNS